MSLEVINTRRNNVIYSDGTFSYKVPCSWHAEPI